MTTKDAYLIAVLQHRSVIENHPADTLEDLLQHLDSNLRALETALSPSERVEVAEILRARDVGKPTEPDSSPVDERDILDRLAAHAGPGASREEVEKYLTARPNTVVWEDLPTTMLGFRIESALHSEALATGTDAGSLSALFVAPEPEPDATPE